MRPAAAGARLGVRLDSSAASVNRGALAADRVSGHSKCYVLLDVVDVPRPTHRVFKGVRRPVKHRGPVHAFAWFCVVAGLGIALISVSYASYETTLREEDWFQREQRSENASRLRRALRDLDEQVRPAWVVMSPWPGVIAGAGVTAFGIILLLAIRRPAPPAK